MNPTWAQEFTVDLSAFSHTHKERAESTAKDEHNGLSNWT